MKMKCKYTLISGFIILFIIVFLLDTLPFLFLWLSALTSDVEESVNLGKRAVNTSVFKFQKIYAMNYTMSGLVLSKDYVTALEYFNKLEEYGVVDDMTVRLAIYAFIKTGNYDAANFYAFQINDKFKIAQIAIITKDYVRAKRYVDELMKSQKVNALTYLFKSQLLSSENRWIEAEKYVDIALTKSPSFVDALYEKAKICLKLGKQAEYKKYHSQAKLLEMKQGNY